MKWDEPPLWPVAIPSTVGFVAALISYMVDGFPKIFGQQLTTPFAILVLVSLLLYFSPTPTGRNFELNVGTNIGMILFFLPQLFLYVWFIVAILFWIFQSMYTWRKNFPAFRIGIWIGNGAVSGLFIGGFIGHYLF